MNQRLRRAALTALALWLCALMTACAGKGGGDVQVLLDGAAWDGRPVAQGADDLKVIVTLDGKTVIELPFGAPHTVTLRQSGVGENTVAVTGEAVYMEHADCENQDCVNMGKVTRENLELRVMGGFIVCLPHRVSVEVRGN